MDLLTIAMWVLIGMFLGWFVVKAPSWAQSFWAWLKEKIDS